jgi:hypothetical protein
MPTASFHSDLNGPRSGRGVRIVAFEIETYDGLAIWVNNRLMFKKIQFKYQYVE